MNTKDNPVEHFFPVKLNISLSVHVDRSYEIIDTRTCNHISPSSEAE